MTKAVVDVWDWGWIEGGREQRLESSRVGVG